MEGKSPSVAGIVDGAKLQKKKKQEMHSTSQMETAIEMVDSSMLSIESVQKTAKDKEKMDGLATAVSSPTDISTTKSSSLKSADEMVSRSRMGKIFAKLEDDVDLVKVLQKYEAKKTREEAKTEKKMELALNILKIASRDKVIEKTVTKEQDQLLGRFFAGRAPYSRDILGALDNVITNMVDHVLAHQDCLDEETKLLTEKKHVVKSALLQAMMRYPKYLPSSWLKPYEERHRANNNWLLGILLGPEDYRTFNEPTEGIFMDTSLIQQAEQAKNVENLKAPIKSLQNGRDQKKGQQKEEEKLVTALEDPARRNRKAEGKNEEAPTTSLQNVIPQIEKKKDEKPPAPRNEDATEQIDDKKEYADLSSLQDSILDSALSEQTEENKSHDTRRNVQCNN